MNSNIHFRWEPLVRRLIVFVAILSAIIPLILYLLSSIREQKISMTAEADVYSHIITDQINQNPAYWQYEEIRFASILRHRLHAGEPAERRQLLDRNYNIIAESGTPLQSPLIHAEVRVFDAGNPVGSLRISQSIRTTLYKSALLFLLTSICGVLIYYILHVFPLKLLRSAFTALHKEKEEATATLKSIADGVITTDTSLHILSINPAAAQLAGVESTVLGDPFGEHFLLCHPETHEKMETLLGNCLKSHEHLYSLPKQAILSRQVDGKEFQVEITVSQLHDEQTRLLGLLIVLHDVTTSRALEKQLKDKVQELSVIVKHAGVGIAFVREGIVQEINSLVSENIDVAPETIIGQEVTSFLPSYLGYTGPVEHIYTKLRKGEIFDIEHQVVHSDQKQFWLRLIGQAVDPSRLREAGSVWITQDITLSKQQQEELQKAKFLAEEASRFKSEFLAHVSHELRNPLGGILGMNLLVLDTELTPFQQKHLTIIQDTAENLLLLINNLLDLSKIEVGAMELEEKPFNIQSVYEYVHNVVALKVQEKGLTLTFSTSEAVPHTLIGDALRLGQILLNLVGNAIKFTPSGTITVSCEMILQTETTIQLQFKVSDSGCGIDETSRKKIFGAFVQASCSVARIHGGSGLGLSICKKLTELMDGEIMVESEPGKGSTFSFTCNFQHKGQPEKEVATGKEISVQLAESSHHAKRILFVDDLPFIQTIAKVLLEQESHSVTMASSGRDALRALAKAPFDTIFMDVQMPLMDGLLTTRLIRRCEKERTPLSREDRELLQAVSSRVHGKHIHIIGMTGNATEEARRDCLAAGMDSYISKPFEREHMLEALKRVGEKDAQ